MKKQINYHNFIPRLFAAIIDLSLITLTISEVIKSFSKYVFFFIYQNFFADMKINTSNAEEVAIAMKMPEIANYITFTNFFLYCGILCLLNLLLIGGYFVGFWQYKGATPGKLLMHMKIVDAETLEKPTTWQLIKRFLGYLTAAIGIWSILFTQKKQALHDKIAGTVVIKS